MPGSQQEDVVSNMAVLHDDPISSLVIRCAGGGFLEQKSEVRAPEQEVIMREGGFLWRKKCLIDFFFLFLLPYLSVLCRPCCQYVLYCIIEI